MKRARPWFVGFAVLLAATPLALSSRSTVQASGPAQPSSHSKHYSLNCAESSLCTEVSDYKQVFGNYYVGHDEPSVLFYSNTPGSGNHMRYSLTLPTEPSASTPQRVGKSYTFELDGAIWFGMAMCDTQSYPEQLTTCPPDSDKNIVDPAVSPKHVGEAFMELQFYPPGWVQWPTWAVAVGASSCDPTHWCAAMNIDSLSLDPVNGVANNAACLAQVGEEYVNFAFISKDGKTPAPANPVKATLTTFTPNPAEDLFMNSGDNVTVALGDTPNGLKATIDDLTSKQTGSMTASAANGFAEVKYDPAGSGCTAIPTNFHPMYSTSTTQTRVTWAAHTYNIAYDAEIGHFQYCRGPYTIPATEFGIDSKGNPTICPGDDTEEQGVNAEANDSDDNFCFPAREAPLYKVNGCTDTNTGFDGASYQPFWPDGNTALHPTPVRFSSPQTGPDYNVQYGQVGFEADLPRIEFSTCNRSTGAGCTLIPQDDDGQPAAFYPFYSTFRTSAGCMWEFGNDIPGEISDYGQNAQYGALLQASYTAKGGGSLVVYNDFRRLLGNPCPQGVTG